VLAVEKIKVGAVVMVKFPAIGVIVVARGTGCTCCSVKTVTLLVDSLDM
jgi:hypothetical protein